MASLIAKTLVRALLIFLPFVFLSWGKETPSEQSASLIDTGLIILAFLLISLGLGLRWWREQRQTLRNSMLSIPAKFGSDTKQDR